MKIACLDINQPGSSAPYFSSHTLTFFCDAATLLQAGETSDTFDAILLAHPDFLKNKETLYAIRQHETCCLTPVFTLKPVALTAVCDGHCDSETEVINTIQRIAQRLKSLHTAPLDEKSRFLAYCYSRAPLDIKPITDWRSPSYYTYPLADLFISDTTTLTGWLEEGVRKELFNQQIFISSRFVCKECESAHLSFTERCPQCHSEHITSLLFLHCFTCGLIAPETEFIKGGRFICPKCSSTLRLIGEDYDRPLESGQCLHCQTYYQEAELWVQCMCCEKDYSPEKLSKNNQYIYQVSATHAENILNHYFIQHNQIFDDIHYAEPHFFMALLDWLFALTQRYPEEIFSLIGLSLSLSSRTVPFLQPFAEHLKTLLRHTDILTRLMDNEIWLLLPKTNQAGLDTLLARLSEARSYFSEKLDWQMVGTTSQEIPKEISTEKLIMQLRSKFL